MLKRYDELDNKLKEEARRIHPNDYTEWWYKIRGVEIEFCCR